MDYYPAFAQLLNQALQAQERTPTWLAKRLQLHPATVNRWLNQGTRPGEPAVIAQIADLLAIAAETRQALFVAAGYGYQTLAPAPSTALNSSISQRQPTQPMMQAAPHTASVDWGEAPDVSRFQGREAELTELSQWLVDDHCSLVAVLGMGGIGKTALATLAAMRVAPAFTHVIWRSLRNAPPLVELLSQCLQELSPQQAQPLPPSQEELVGLFMTYLRQQRCLLILDNFETVLQAEQTGHYLPGYEDYGQLLQQIGEGRHQSCLLLTSREKPKEFVPMAGAQRPVRAFVLLGLLLADSRALLRDSGLSGQTEHWETLQTRYSGNPLALQIVAETIRELFAGDIAAFLGEQTVLLSDIAELLAQQFGRLTPLEQSLLFWLAVARETVTLTDLYNDLMQPPAKVKVLDALRALHRRSLLERTQNGFGLQNVVLEYVTATLLEQAWAELISGHFVWLQRQALFKAQAKSYIQESQRTLLLVPLVNRLVTQLGRQLAQTHLAGLLEGLRQTYRHQPGYAGGNLLNLLAQLKGNLCDMDFSQLAVWEANLRGVLAQDANFHQADLTRSVFTDTFGSVICVAFNPQGTQVAAGTIDKEVRLWRVQDGTPLLTCLGHQGWVYSVCFSPDGQRLASSSADQTVRVWHGLTGHCLLTLQGHTGDVKAICFSPDGTLLASASYDQTIRLWDSQTGECIHTLSGHTGWVNGVSFHPNGKLLASAGSDQSIRLWDVQQGQSVGILWGHTNVVWCINFSPDGNLLASGSYDQTIRLWDSQTGECLRIQSGHTSWVYALCFSQDGQRLVSGDHGETSYVWDTQTGRCLHTLRGSSVCFHPAGYLVASGSIDQTVRLWDSDTGQCLHMLQGYTNPVLCIGFSPNGQLLATGSGDHIVRLWDSDTGQCLHTLHGHTDLVWSVCFSPDGKRLASSSKDSTIRLWDSQTGASLHVLHGHTAWVDTLAFSPDGQWLASGSDDTTIRVWNSATGQCQRVLYGHTDFVNVVCYSPHDHLLASASVDQTVRVWHSQTGECLHILRGHTNAVVALCFTPDGKLMASGSDDGTIRLWDSATGQCLRTLAEHQNSVKTICFSPDGAWLASGSEDATVRLWKLASDQHHILRGHTRGITAISYHPNGDWLASASVDQTVRVWDSQTGTCLHILQGHTNEVFRVCVSPDSQRIASSSYDATAKLWDGQTGACLATLRSDRPYERMNISGVTGLTSTQLVHLKALGALEDKVQ